MYKKNPSILPEPEQNQWFSLWFNTPYYHLLYNNRNYAEAESFINNLLTFLKPSPGSYALDLACGAGRHSITLNRAGLNVLGVDLAENSIIEAKKSENSTLHFEVHDMREILHINTFDIVFNLFTSFGYFENTDDDLKVLQACQTQLKANGLMVLDYFNVEKIIPSLPYQGIESRGEIDFQIQKKIHEKHIIKSIDFQVNQIPHHFEEKVAAYQLPDFIRMFNQAGFSIKHIFGNYNLEPYDSNSERVIIIAERN